jgi:hypothetical protein
MIPVSTFNMFVALGIVFSLFSVIDLKNKMYANIVAAFIASMMWGYLSAIMAAGIVQYDSGLTIQDTSVSIITFFIAIVFGIYALLMVYEARNEKLIEAEDIG